MLPLLFQQQVFMISRSRPVALHIIFQRCITHECCCRLNSSMGLQLHPGSCSLRFAGGIRRSILLASQTCIHKSFAHKHHKSPPRPFPILLRVFVYTLPEKCCIDARDVPQRRPPFNPPPQTHNVFTTKPKLPKRSSNSLIN